MKIFYKQPETGTGPCSLERFGIENCYFKELTICRDQKNISKKLHHHTGFELHIIVKGFQVYEIEGNTHTVRSGSFMLIPPYISHRFVDSDRNTQKYSITFYLKNETIDHCVIGEISRRMEENILFIVGEAKLRKEISFTLIENSILEMIVSVLRVVGVREERQNPQDKDNTILSLAKQYIESNIERSPDVFEVSEYCHLSTKQLTRIFGKFEGVAPGEYIKDQRVRRIEELLADNSLSLKEISERMNFSSEYYFNSFFKKRAGMPPGEYRKMLGT